ncbi:class I SAM-dependent DNA methyltransferase [soil metagenome]
MEMNQFIDKWSRANRTERQAAQEHFIDLCRVLGEPTPNEAADPGTYSFEKGASKIDGSPGFADVWMRGHFGWEYKKDRANLDRAYQQLQLYSVALENPPLLVVSDTKRFRIYTNWTNTVQTRHEFALEDLAQSATRELLRNVFKYPDRLKPDKTREQVTKDAAKEFTTIAERLRMSGHPPEKVAHFLNRLVFCLFAEDVNLLENDLFKRMLDNIAKRRDTVGAQSQRMFADLFREMRGGGNYGLEHILHFNGGLFEDDTTLPLDPDSLDILRNIARLDWSAIDPSIFGTLFERFLDPDKRAQIGAHYTDPEKIMMIVNPVMVRPLTAEWDGVKAELAELLSKNRNKNGTPGQAALSRAEARFDQFLKRLDDVHVLDPACGSGNFLYLALQSLKDLEYRAIVEAEAMGLARRVVHCGPRNVKGIEINPYAAELARTAIWIGNIQWQRRNGFEARKEPVLEDLDAIECRDALVTKKEDGGYEEASWPEAEFIVGNPPFLGSSKMRKGLGNEYAELVRKIYKQRVSPSSDLVCWWFEIARQRVLTGGATRAGLVATNSISGGKNRLVLDKISSDLEITVAYSDEPWVVDGADVRVAIVCFANRGIEPDQVLDGVKVGGICPDLTTKLPSGRCICESKSLREVSDLAYQGVITRGPFDIAGIVARDFLSRPRNPNGQRNSDVIFPILNGDDIADRPRDTWVIDFSRHSREEASLYEGPYQQIADTALAARQKARDKEAVATWWQLWRTRAELRKKISTLSRYIITPRVSKHRIFIWANKLTVPDDATVGIAREDDVSFGVVHSRFHEAWSLRRGTWLGVGNDPRYTPTTTFETFPFPEGLTPNIAASSYADDPRAIAIAKAAKRLDELRNAWLNPPDLIDIVPEIVPGYPDRILPKTEAAAAILKKRTLTNLYNARPQWLADAHRDLDAAVAAAYGWPADITEEDALAKLLELNLSRAGAEAGAVGSEDDDDGGPDDTPKKATQLTREEFAKISEVEGLRLSDEMNEAFVDFDRRKLTAEQRRQEIIDRFKRVAQ